MDTIGTTQPPRPAKRRRTEEQRAADRAVLSSTFERAARVLLPVLVILGLLGAWELAVQSQRTPPAALPAPSLILEALVQHHESLAPAWWYSARITLLGLAFAAATGVLLATAFALSRWVAMALGPIVLALQITPVVAFAPLLLLQVDPTPSALVACVALVALHPVLSGTAASLARVDFHLRELYALYGASPWQRLHLLLAPSALPGFAHGLKLAAGLAPAAAVAAEFVAAWVLGPGARPAGLAARLLLALQGRDVAVLWATLVLAVLLGLVFFGLAALLSRVLVGRWHVPAGWRPGAVAR